LIGPHGVFCEGLRPKAKPSFAITGGRSQLVSLPVEDVMAQPLLPGAGPRGRAARSKRVAVFARSPIFADGMVGRMMYRAFGILLIFSFAGPGAAQADVLSLSTKSRAGLFKSQTSVLDGRAARQYSNSVRLQPPSVVTPSKYASPGYNGKYRGPYLDMARAAARRHGVPEDLFLRLVQQESGWRANAKSHKGALGLAQLMPATARTLRVNPRVPSENLDGGARYLRQQYETFRSWRLALAAYNAGPAAVHKHGGVPPYRETRNYVRKIWGS